jgi:hypothetical protein
VTAARVACLAALLVVVPACGAPPPPGDRPDATVTLPRDDAAVTEAPDGAAATCPLTAPRTGTPCALDAGIVCVYGVTGCATGAASSRRGCRCAASQWTCPCLTP